MSPRRLRVLRIAACGALFVSSALCVASLLRDARWVTSLVSSSFTVTTSGSSSKHENTSDTILLIDKLPPITIVTQLSGELGNHMGKLATALALALELQPQHEAVDIQLRHQTHPKWNRAARDFQSCLPLVQTFNISEANVPLFATRMEQLHQWNLETKYAPSKRDSATISSTTTTLAALLDDSINGPIVSPEQLDETLRWLNEHWNQFRLPEKLSSSSNPMGDTFHMEYSSQTSISFPFLYANHLAGYDVYVDRHYDALRRFFAWDFSKTQCCALRPHPDETVWHFRNFLHEMPRKGMQKGYQELQPHDVAQQLLGNLPPGSKVAMVTRFADDDIVQQYQKALEQRGLDVRVIANQTSLQDFCFLLSTQKELVGLARSTYFFWAGLLGTAQVVRAYSVDSPAKRASSTPLFDGYNWTHPQLQQRIQFELYTATPGL